MMGHARTFLLGLTIGIALSACATPPPKVTDAELGPAPKNTKALAAAYMKTKLFDPYSVRDAQITVPFIGRVNSKPGWVVCTRQNAKNRYGAYTGIQSGAVLFQNGVAVDSTEEASVCDGDPHVPWPEMMAVTGR